MELYRTGCCGGVFFHEGEGGNNKGKCCGRQDLKRKKSIMLLKFGKTAREHNWPPDLSLVIETVLRPPGDAGLTVNRQTIPCDEYHDEKKVSYASLRSPPPCSHTGSRSWCA